MVLTENLFLAPASSDGFAYDHLQTAVVEGIREPEIQVQAEYEELVPLRVWGVSSGLETSWGHAKEGDWMLFYTGDNIYRYATRIVGKEHNPELGEVIRSEFLDVSELEQRRNQEWEYLFYLSEPVQIELSGTFLSGVLGYARTYCSRFQRVSNDRLEAIEDNFGNISSLVEEHKRLS
jgi:hypothetical protein